VAFNGDHLRDHVRKDFRGFQRIHEAFAALNAGAYFRDCFLDNHVTGRLGGDVERLQDRNAGREQRRQRARETRNGDLAEDIADDRDLQQDAIDDSPAARSRIVELDRYTGGDDRGEYHESAPAGEKFAYAHNDSRRQRQLFAWSKQTEKDVLKLRDHDDHDHGHRYDRQ